MSVALCSTPTTTAGRARSCSPQALLRSACTGRRCSGRCEGLELLRLCTIQSFVSSSKVRRLELLICCSFDVSQVRVEGTVEKLSEEESTEYYHSRPHGSQVSRWGCAAYRLFLLLLISVLAFFTLSCAFHPPENIPILLNCLSRWARGCLSSRRSCTTDGRSWKRGELLAFRLGFVLCVEVLLVHPVDNHIALQLFK